VVSVFEVAVSLLVICGEDRQLFSGLVDSIYVRDLLDLKLVGFLVGNIGQDDKLLVIAGVVFVFTILT
jgi:hypothetical protein